MPSQASLAAAFKAFDTDGSGTLSADELLGILTRGGGALTVDDAKAVIAVADRKCVGCSLRRVIA